MIRCNMAPGEPGHRPDCPWPHDVEHPAIGAVMGVRDAQAVPPIDLLTAAEHRAMDLTTELYNLLAREVVGKMPSRAGDLSEIATHLHAIQNVVLAQAACRSAVCCRRWTSRGRC